VLRVGAAQHHHDIFYRRHLFDIPQPGDRAYAVGEDALDELGHRHRGRVRRRQPRGQSERRGAQAAEGMVCLDVNRSHRDSVQITALFPPGLLQERARLDVVGQRFVQERDEAREAQRRGHHQNTPVDLDSPRRRKPYD
jgi:hypothetical protein